MAYSFNFYFKQFQGRSREVGYVRASDISLAVGLQPRDYGEASGLQPRSSVGG